MDAMNENYLQPTLPSAVRRLEPYVTRVTWSDSITGKVYKGLLQELLGSMMTVIPDDSPVLKFVAYKDDWKVVD